PSDVTVVDAWTQSRLDCGSQCAGTLFEKLFVGHRKGDEPVSVGCRHQFRHFIPLREVSDYSSRENSQNHFKLSKSSRFTILRCHRQSDETDRPIVGLSAKDL